MNRDPLKVYIGYDPRQWEAYAVAAESVRRNASRPVSITPIMLDRNEEWGLMRKRWIIRKNRMFDMQSSAFQSTEFAISRFLVPMLAQTGHAVFMDSDVVVLGDIYDILQHTDPHVAVSVVKHDHTVAEYDTVKMDGQVQTGYYRKNWSSVVLWNVDHHANRRLTMDQLSDLPGSDLHQFCWLYDNEIGSLAPEWNWLVGVQPKPLEPKIAHFTLGGPWLPNWKEAEHDDIWLSARRKSASKEEVPSLLTRAKRR